MPDKSYKRLTWRRRRATKIALNVPRSTLLLGEDHILKVESSIFSESYRRFFFRDIESISIRTNRRRDYWNMFLVLFLILLVLEALLDTETTTPWLVLVVTTASVTAALLLINNLFGATCDVRIQTAVQTDTLVPLSRVKRAERALERIRPLIIQAQGQFTPEETVLRLREFLSPAPPAAKPDPPAGLSAHL